MSLRAAVTVLLACLCAAAPSLSAAHATAPMPAHQFVAPLPHHAVPTESGTEAVTGSDDAADETAVSLQIAPISPVWNDTDREFRVTAILTNHTETDIPASVLTLSISDALVTSAAAWAVPLAEDTQRQISRSQISALSPGETREFAVSFARAQLPFTGDTPAGAYVLSGELMLRQTEPFDAYSAPLANAAAVPVTWVGLAEGSTVPVTFVVPFTLPASISVMPTASQLESEIPRLSTLLTAAQSVQATLAIDPRILVAIRAAGEAASPAATAFLTAIEAAPQSKFLLQFADADPAAEAALGATELLTPVGFSFVTRSGVFPVEPADTVQRSPDDTAETVRDAASASDSETSANGDANIDADTDASGANSDATDTTPTTRVPTTAELSKLPGATASAWPAAGQVSGATLQLLRHSEIDTLVLSAENVSGAHPRVTVDGFDALVAHTGLTESAANALAAPNRTERARAETELFAGLTVLGSAESAGVVVTLDRAASALDSDAATLLDAVSAQSWIAPTPASDLPSAPATLVAGAVSDARQAGLQQLVDESEQIESLSPLLVTPEYLREYQQLRLLSAFATRYAAPDLNYDALVERVSDRNEQLLRGVEAVATENTQLIGTSSRLPVTLHNHLPFDALVTLETVAGSAAIEVNTTVHPNILVPANGNAVSLVGVSSRVSSGESVLHITVSNSAHTQQFSQSNLPLTLRTTYETVLLVVLGAAAVSLLVAGIWRSVRRKRLPADPATPQPAPTENL